MDNLPYLPTEKRSVVNIGGKPAKTQTESGVADRKKKKKQKSYPQLIHFLWITVDKSVHTNHRKKYGTDGSKKICEMAENKEKTVNYA